MSAMSASADVFRGAMADATADLFSSPIHASSPTTFGRSRTVVQRKRNTDRANKLQLARVLTDGEAAKHALEDDGAGAGCCRLLPSCDTVAHHGPHATCIDPSCHEFPTQNIYSRTYANLYALLGHVPMQGSCECGAAAGLTCAQAM
jgi:hypothetical protein